MKLFYKYSALFITIFALFLSFNIKTNANLNNSSIENIKKQGYITVATNAEFPPFEYLENGKETGIDIEISSKIAKKLGVELKIKNSPFNSLILMLQNNMCDFVASGLSYDEERAKNVDFSDSYLSGFQKIIVLKDSNIKNQNDLNNKRVGVQIGTTGDTYCSKRPEINTVRLAKPTDAILALLNKQIDAIVMDEFSANVLIDNNDKLKKLDENLTKEDYNIAVYKGNTELLNVINETISEMKSSGEMDSILHKYDKTNESKFKEYSSYIIKGLKNTLIMAFFAALIGILLGIITSIDRNLLTYNKNFKILSGLEKLYTTVVRFTPALIQLFIIYYGITSHFSIGHIDIIAAIIAFGINSGAYVSEHVRAGIASVNKGQMEAGRSLGLTQRTTMRKIILPQAIKNILPSLVSEFITLLKETAVASYIGIIDLARAGDIIISKSYDAFTPLVVVAIIYLILVVGLTTLLSKFERRLHKNDLH